MYNFNEYIIFLEKIIKALDTYSFQRNNYCFNNQEYKSLAKQIIKNTFNLSEENIINDEVYSELFKILYETDKKNSFDKILVIFKKYKRTYFTIYFYNEEQKEFFLSKASAYIIDNLITINNFKIHLENIDKNLENIFKEHKQYMWNGTLPKIIPENFDNLLELYNFFEINMDLEHLNRESNIIIDSLLYIILENEEENIYYYSSDKSFKLIQHILNSAIKSNDTFLIDKIIHTHNLKLNCFLLTQKQYYHFAFINLLRKFHINNITSNKENKIYETILETLVEIFFEQYDKHYDSNKNEKLYFLVDYIINWKSELQKYLLELFQNNLQNKDLKIVIEIGLNKNNISFLHFMFNICKTTINIEKKTLEVIATHIVKAFIQSYDKSFNLFIYKNFDFKSLFKYTNINIFLTFCKTLNEKKNDHNKYRFSYYFKVLFTLYNKDIEKDILKITLDFAKTDYGLNLGLISQNNFIPILNLFDLSNYEKVLKEIDNVDDLLQIYNVVIDIKKRNIITKKLENIEIKIVSKDSAFLAQQLGFNKLSNKILSMLKDDETSKFVKCKIELLNIYTDNSISQNEKFDKLNSFTINVKNHFKKQYCRNYLTFLHTILNFKENPKYVYDSLKKLFNNTPEHLYLINLASAYIEYVKNDEDRIGKLEYLIEEFKKLFSKLGQNMIDSEYEILLYLYNETNNFIEFEKLWQSMQIIDMLNLNIIKIRIDFLIKKLQATEAIEFLDKIEQYFSDAKTLNEIKDLRVEIKNGAKQKLETIGMRFENMIQEEKTYDVVLSFAGEQRTYVEKVAKALKEKKVNVFYDDYEIADMWGKDLYEHLDEIYSKRSKYAMMFISKEYAEKLWTNHERKSIQEREFIEDGYILPIKFDDTKIKAIRNTKGYLDANTYTPQEIVDIFLKKFYGE